MRKRLRQGTILAASVPRTIPFHPARIVGYLGCFESWRDGC